MTLAALPPPRSHHQAALPCPDRTRFAVVDLETTGLDARTDRVLECAIVEADAAGQVVDEWSTLVAIPGIDEPGAQPIHGISRQMLGAAPRFADIAADLSARLAGRIVVGHVLAFDLEHLRAEFSRAGVCFPELGPAGLCTRELARAFLPPGPRTLAACCDAADVPLHNPHTALGDARAAARLLEHFIEKRCPINFEGCIRRAATVVWPRLEARGGPCRVAPRMSSTGPPTAEVDPRIS